MQISKHMIMGIMKMDMMMSQIRIT